MLSETAFKSLSKNDMYDLYLNISQKLEQKEKFIEDYIKLHVTSNNKITGDDNRAEKYNNGTVSSREFQPFPLKSSDQNLVIGSSIVGRLIHDRNIPDDSTIHAFRGSTTKEKISTLKKYADKNLKTVIIQDGTNSILKEKHTEAEELFEGFIQLVDLVQTKFKPENIVLCEVPPVQNSPDENKRIDEFNKLLEGKYNSMEGIQILEINKMVKSFQNPRQLYYDNYHFNNTNGLPFLRNCLLSQLLKTSTGVCNKRYYPQTKTVNSYRKNWNRGYYPFGYN